MFQTIELQDAARRHALFYLQKLKSLRNTYDDAPRDALHQLRQKMPQIQHALQWCLQYSTDDDISRLYVDMLYAGLDIIPLVLPPDEWQRWLDAGLPLAQTPDAAVERLGLLMERSAMAFDRGRLDDAAYYAEQCIALDGDSALPLPKMGRAYYLYAVIQQKRDEREHATHMIQRARALFTEAGDDYGIGRVTSFEAQLAIDDLNYDRAYALLQQNIDLWQRTSNARQLAVEQYQLGLLLDNRLQHAQAQPYLEKARAIFHELSETRYEAYCLQTLASSYLDTCHIDDALSAVQQAYDLFQQVQDERGKAATLNTWGKIHTERGDTAAALSYHQQAAQIAHHIDYTFHLCEAYRLQALLESDITVASDLLQRAYDVADRSAVKGLAWQVLTSIAVLFVRQGNMVMAAQCAKYIAAQTQEPLILKQLEAVVTELHTHHDAKTLETWQQSAQDIDVQTILQALMRLTV